MKSEFNLHISETDFDTAGHVVQNCVLYPAVAYLGLVWNCEKDLRRSWREKGTCLTWSEAYWWAPMEPGERGTGIRIETERIANGTAYRVWSEKPNAAGPLATGVIGISELEPKRFPFLDIASIRNSAVSRLDKEEIYSAFSRHGIRYAGRFKCIEEIHFGEGGTLARLKTNRGDGGSPWDVCALDGVMQTFLMTLLEHQGEREMYVPFSLGTWIFHGPMPGDAFIYTIRSSTHPQDGEFRFDAIITDTDGKSVATLDGLCVRSRSVTDSALPAGDAKRICIASSFTSEPVREPLSFWMAKMNGTIPEIVFAPYNQVFQTLLDPSGPFANGSSGLNQVFIRSEDLLGPEGLRDTELMGKEKDALLDGKERHTLPNGLEIAHSNLYETRYLYEEIFVEKTYLKHGVNLGDGDVVIDIGANIGMFSLFVAREYPGCTVFAFEPSPATFELLSANARIHAPGVRPCPWGISGEDGDAEFTFYERSSVFSGFHSDIAKDTEAIRSVVENAIRSRTALSEESMTEHVDQLMEGRLASKSIRCPIKKLSTVFRELGITRVDLLKVDAEKSEWGVLVGIDPADWDMIRQVVIEVHGEDAGLAEKVIGFLSQKGFEVIHGEEGALSGSGLSNLYARRKSELSADRPSILRDRVSRNLAELESALHVSAARDKAPLFLCVCPPSPAFRDSVHAEFIDRLETRLVGRLNSSGTIHAIKASDFADRYPFRSYHDSLRDAMGHIPYTPRFFSILATLAARRVYGVSGRAFKAIALDCDQTLWKGICGEEGAKGVKIESAQALLQRLMADLQAQGILLCLLSKNNPDDVFQVFGHNEDMILKLDQFAAHRIGWSPKDEGIRRMAEQLNIGLESFIFLDDSPLECAAMKAKCPEVLTLRLPDRDSDIPGFLRNVWPFDLWTVSEEDRSRNRKYREESMRNSLRESTTSLQEFLDSLEVQVRFQTAADSHIARISQLTAKTNQFNFTTLRRNASQIDALLKDPAFGVRIVHVTDRFGDYGIVGLIIWREEGKRLIADTVLLSCRSLGRGVEHRMIAELGRLAMEKGMVESLLPFSSTAKNEPARAFLASIGKGAITGSPDDPPLVFPSAYLASLTYSPEEAPAAGKSADRHGPDQAGLAGYSASLPALGTSFHEVVLDLRDPDVMLLTMNAGLLDAFGGNASSGHAEPSEFSDNPAICYLNRIFTEILRPQHPLPAEGAGFDRLGLDSMRIIEVLGRMENDFGKLPKTLLFEYQDVQSLAGYLLEKYPDTFKRLSQDDANAAGTPRLNIEAMGPEELSASGAAEFVTGRQDIAIVGMSGRYPLAPDLERFWKNLLEGKDCVRGPGDRRGFHRFQDPREPLQPVGYTDQGGFLDDVEYFDPLFFNISPAEAERLDPQQRLFLEEAWHTLEDAGYVWSERESDVGVFVGVMTSTYGLVGLEASLRGSSSLPDYDHYEIPNRVSYFFNFNGPSMAVDTACSSSLTALHLACESIRRGECGSALAGGVSLILHPSRYAQYCAKNMLSRDGRSKAFGAEANGFADGEGVGCVYLKSLQKALEDGDRIHGVIRGSAINSGGRTSGFTVPNPKAQEKMIRRAIENAGLDPRTITYLEAHGTGTILGDPIEIKGLANAFSHFTGEKGFCAMGSVKSNIGHLEAAAGIAGLTKVLLQMRHRTLAPSLHCAVPNPAIEFGETPFRLQLQAEAWSRSRASSIESFKEIPLRAGISSFGAGGSNAHVIVEEPPFPKAGKNTPAGISRIFVLSAKTESALKRKRIDLANHLRNGTTIDLADLSFTLNCARAHFDRRIAFIAKDAEGLLMALDATDQVSGPTVYRKTDSGNAPVNGFPTEPLNDESNLRKLAEFFVSGGNPDWRFLYKDSEGRIISLPPYPFEMIRCWINVASPVPDAAAVSEWPDRVDIETGTTPAREALVGAPEVHSDAPDPDRQIAIIGIAGVFPGAADVREFWANLAEGRDMIREVPPDRWNWKDYPDSAPKEADKTGIRWGGFLDDLDKFDPLFFGISPREAELMDPQQRIFLETVWNAIEDAGYKASDLSGTDTGLFVGVAGIDYFEMMARQGTEISAHTSTGMAHSILANRISYLLNFSGPSVPIDTACSSSLIAIHRAVESIRKGRCGLAIAGGVNALISPTMSVSFGKAGMLSPEGRCRTFDSQADGYVRGEGAGALLLKPLDQAIADGDSIYAVIKGSAENHGGRANSLTAPNPSAQADLLVEAYIAAKVDPRTVGYIEAHGTATRLGDPVEINGMKKAFERLYALRGLDAPAFPHCGIGSVKTHIGHLETAAGVAGVIKVLMSMKHATLPANLNFRNLNPFIKLEGSPFRVVDRTRPWERLLDDVGEPCPRRAGISSFGFGGANAHLVLEEYIPKKTELNPVLLDLPQAFNLSAKKPDQLLAQAQGLLEFCQSWRASGESSGEADFMREMAYTLQVGREEMEERVSILAEDLESLMSTLGRFSRGEKNLEGVFLSKGKFTRKEWAVLLEGRAGAEFLRALAADREIGRIARLWAEGVNIPWKEMYGASRPRRISLPTYAFARERYWILHPAGKPVKTGNGTEVGIVGLHPLLDSNESGLDKVLFRKRFLGKEFFLRDHIVCGKMFLPGVVYLEMARAACSLANRSEEPVRLSNIIWQRPFVASENGKDVLVSLVRHGQKVKFKIVDGEDPEHVFCFGETETIPAPTAITAIDLDAIRNRCTLRRRGEECYGNFGKIELEYGPAFRSIMNLDGNERECLSELEFPTSVKSESKGFLLPPSLLDGALQSVMGLLWNSSEENVGLHLPYGLTEIEILSPIPERCFAYATWAGPNRPGNGNTLGFDILLADARGAILASLKNFTVRPLNPQATVIPSSAIAGGAPGAELSVLFLRKTWVLEALPSPARDPGSVLVFAPATARAVGGGWESTFQKSSGTGRVIVVYPGTGFREIGPGTYEIHPAEAVDYSSLLDRLALDNEFPATIVDARAVSEMPGIGNAENSFDPLIDHGFQPLFLLCQALLRKSTSIPLQVIHVHSPRGDAAGLQNKALMGFSKTVSKENPRISLKILETGFVSIPEGLASACLEEARSIGSGEIRLHEGRRWIRKLTELGDCPAHGGFPATIRERGVYLVTGGQGGLGRLFAEHFATEARARLVLTGRSPETQETRWLLNRLRSLGGEGIYIPCDVADLGETLKLAETCRNRFGGVDGIVHAAGIIRDAYIIKKDVSDLKRVLAPKVQGTINLDQAFAGDNLAFFSLFSSITGVMGNAGQADYCFANGFMDAFAEWREHLRKRGARSGRTLSIGWPLWKEGGMRVVPAIEKMLASTTGMSPLPTPQGIAAFFKCLASEESSITVAAGLGPKLKGSLGADWEPFASPEPFHPSPPPPSGPAMVPHEHQGLDREVRFMAASILKLDPDQLEVDMPLGDFGFDSISLTELANRVNDRFKTDLTPAVFFEHGTLASFQDHLRKTLSTTRDSPPLSNTPTQPPVSVAPKEDTGREVLLIACDILKIHAEQIDWESPLSDYGFDSISLTELANRVNDRFGLDLTPVVFFEHATLDSFVRFLDREFGPGLAGAGKPGKVIFHEGI